MTSPKQQSLIATFKSWLASRPAAPQTAASKNSGEPQQAPAAAPATPAVIASIGMTTALGLNAVHAAANIRASMRGCAEETVLNHEFSNLNLGTVPIVPTKPIPPEIEKTPYFTSRKGRLMLLAAHAITDCLKNAPRLPTPPPLFLALPEHQSATDLKAPPFLRTFQALTGKIFDLDRSRCEWSGRAGGILAIGEAVKEIEQGKAEFILVAGVDSPLDLESLTRPDYTTRLRADRMPDSFTPGEAAGAVLLASASVAARLGLQTSVNIRVHAAGKGFEEGHIGSDAPYRGEGMSDAINALVEASPPKEPVREFFSTMNGEGIWGRDWGMTQTRHSKLFAPTCNLHHTAQSTGDIGAAFGTILAGLAAIGATEHYRQLPAMIYGSNDNGECAVTILSSI